ncbi:patatin-domain-containing protein [Piedraia hortae CBS 480.64]|uniref:Patatin-domain-containing protein n=1 Tax=Piedraia hortae CBS 480.64 TaxID=1314780 RepID=A0A6A7BPQ3_9PEZI|nr:patatin-domain-containing protein [Piedraia hortae CBS 480.64]
MALISRQGSTIDSWNGQADTGLRRSRDGRLEFCGHSERQFYLLRLAAATTAAEWQAAAEELDELDGAGEWKEEDESDEYDVELVQARLYRLEESRRKGDFADLMLQIRSGLTRNLGGMGHVGLYRHSRTGTKRLIERYIDAVVAAIEAVAASPTLDPLPLFEEMKLARQSFGRSALLLSGGGTLGLNHVGVVKTLAEARLLPRIISGASAGSIVCAVLCTSTDDEMDNVLDAFAHGDLDFFEAAGEEATMGARLTRFLTTGVIYDVKNLERVMKQLLGNMTFQEAYNRTQRILNICVSSAGVYEQPRLLNYITAPDVMIWSAVAASCSVPLVFSAAQLQAKDPRTGAIGQWTDDATRWIDGSVDNDLPMTRLAEMLNVNHFIVSQVNPHVVPFLTNQTAADGWIQTLTSLARAEALHRMHMLSEMGIFPTTMTKMCSVLGQRYAGDITILPEISYAQFPTILANPTPESIALALANGERATWPELSRVRNHLAIELSLDAAVHTLLHRLAFSPSQVHLRQTVINTGPTRSNTFPKKHRKMKSQGFEDKGKWDGDDNV